MKEITFPTQSTSTIIKASIVAFLIAVIISVMVILPAEYNIDPTGIGAKLGLTQLSQSESQPVIAPVSKIESILPYQEDMVEVVVPANKGVEYKFYLKQYGSMTYEWQTQDGTPLYFDFHGEPEGDKTGYFESYTITTANDVKGSMTMPFTGSHGWYWKNTTGTPVILTLKTTGNYKISSLKQ
ncbi:MAG: hypothetical protein DRQ47_07905 [Gammaproteobacteria bacterium]|nr:MAG: hypothetical protein DRQ47_07905 [Gammaproteobacteria bacterium]